MTKLIIIFMLFQLLILQAHAQLGSYVNHTELGPLIGKINQSDSRINFSLQSFNGINIHPHHSIGLLIGVDTYPGVTLMPLALGWRGTLRQENRTSPMPAWVSAMVRRGLKKGRGKTLWKVGMKED